MMDSLLLIKARPVPGVVAAEATSQPIEPHIPTPVRLSCDGPPPALHRLPPRDGNHVFDIASTTGGGVVSLERLVQDLAKLHEGRLRSQVVSVQQDNDDADDDTAKKRRRLSGDDGGSDESDSNRGESTPLSPLSSPSCPSGSAPRPLSPASSSSAWLSYPFKFPTLTTTMPTSSSMAAPTSSSSTPSSSTSSALSPASSPPRFTSFSATLDPFVEQTPPPPKVSIKKRKPRVKLTGRVCTHCGVVKTSEWRMGPEGRGTLCNACGLRYRKKLKAESQRQQAAAGQGLQACKIPLSMLLNSHPAVPPTHQRRTAVPINNNDADNGLVRGRPTATGHTGNFAAAIA